MKNQQVSVDVWAMVKTMLSYFFLAILGGIFIRLVMTALALPGRLSAQRENVQKAMDELKKKYPDTFKQVTEELEEEERLKNAKGKEDDQQSSIEGKKVN